jgi:hypothetical protein
MRCISNGNHYFTNNTKPDRDALTWSRDTNTSSHVDANVDG